MKNEIFLGDCAAVLKGFPDKSLDATVTDPPYGLGTKEPTGEEIDAYLKGAKLDHGGDFMNKDWEIPPVAVWREVYRLMKPKGLLMAFAGTRTLDIMAAGIDAAGFHYIGLLAWCRSQGFPKNLDVSKAIDRKAGATREVVGFKKGVGGENLNDIVRGAEVRDMSEEGAKGVGAYGTGAKQKPIDIPVTAPATPEAAEWDGWGTAMRPLWEPILVFSRGKTSWKMPEIPFFHSARAGKKEATVNGEVDNNHPTKKPLDLMSWLVKLASKPGDLILDPYLGSGTTAAACAEYNRSFVGIERDPGYYEIARKRVGLVKERAEEYYDLSTVLEQLQLPEDE